MAEVRAPDRPNHRTAPGGRVAQMLNGSAARRAAIADVSMSYRGTSAGTVLGYAGVRIGRMIAEGWAGSW